MHGIGTGETKDRVWAAVAVTLGLLFIAGPSRVPLDLWIIDGYAAQAVVAGWVAVMVGIIAYPSWAHGHVAAAGLGFLVLTGRGGGFLTLVLDNRPDLWVAVAERAAMAILGVLWHIRAIKIIDLRRIVIAYSAMVDDLHPTHPTDRLHGGARE